MDQYESNNKRNGLFTVSFYIWFGTHHDSGHEPKTTK